MRLSADTAPDAYERLVDRLLASPHYGERMALPWLDAARYADSNGFQQDGDTWQWIWRDWVVRALNADLPFDQFTTWQLAGDLLPEATTDQKIASGFNRNHLLNGEGGAIAEEQRWVILFDRIDTTATTWLGLTMACAQCHDHKYDPLTQRDYYSLLDAFNRVPESGTPQFFSSRIRVANPVLELPTAENQAKIAEFESQIAAADAEAKDRHRSRLSRLAGGAHCRWEAGGSERPGGRRRRNPAAKPEGERIDDEKKSLEAGLRKHFEEKVQQELAGKLPQLAKLDSLRKQLADYKADKLPRVMIMSDAQPRETKILSRGEYLTPTEKVVVRDASVPAAAGRRSADESTGTRAVARVARASAHGPRAGQSNVAALLRHWDREDCRGFRRAKRVSDSRPAARLAGGRVPRARLEHEGHAPADRDQRDVSAIQPRDARTAGPR